ncbi:UNVERIFIED_CONTAM: hypothetical protein FKN15_059839 [Acipenser sinensis]
MSSISFGGSIIQQLSFSSGGEEDSCDSSLDDWSSRENSPKAGWRMTKECQSPRASENKEGLTGELSLGSASPCTPRGSRSPTGDCHGTPLHYATWRKLRLCDSPNTPKSLLSKARVLDSSSKFCRGPRLLRFTAGSDPAPPTRVPSVNVNPFTPEPFKKPNERHKRKSMEDDDEEGRDERKRSDEEDVFLPSKSLLSKARVLDSSSKFCRGPRLLRFTAGSDPAPPARVPSVNVNPFTPEPFKKPNERHKRKNMEDDDEEGRDERKRSDEEDVFLPSKRFALHENNMVSRYETEFLELERIGAGEFGAVYKCVKRLDGCLYAIKRSKRPLAGSTDDFLDRQLCLNTYPCTVQCGVVVWALEGRGSLQDAISRNAVEGHFFQEPELKEILLQVSMGLKYIHSSRLVHLDIKPSNIFVCRRAVPLSHLRGEEDESEEEDGEDCATDVVYKIGDLGHVASTSSPHVEEGDIRFLASEILQEMLIHSDVSLRPSASGLCRHPVLRRGTGKTAAQLLKELKVEKFRTAMLERELKEARLAASSPPKDPRYIRHANWQHDSAPRQGGRRLIGGKAARSMSFNCAGH